MVKEVNSPNLKICLDAPIMEKQDADYLRQAVLDVGPLMVHSHYGRGVFAEREWRSLSPVYSGTLGRRIHSQRRL